MGAAFSHRKHHPHSEPGSFLLEAVLSAAIALTTLALIAPMFAQQLVLARRARDTALVEAAVNQDINSFKQVASLWRQTSGPFSEKLINSSATKTLCLNYPGSNITQYSNRVDCTKPPTTTGCALGQSFLTSFRSDVGTAHRSITGNFLATIQDLTPVPGYTINRQARTISDPDGRISVRLIYSITRSDGSPSELAFSRSVDLLPEAFFSC
jgi:hypothetical protein